MIPLEERKPSEQEQEMERHYLKNLKASGIEPGMEGLSEGALDLIESFAKLRANSLANAHLRVVR
jgi:hypothetical protein